MYVTYKERQPRISKHCVEKLVLRPGETMRSKYSFGLSDVIPVRTQGEKPWRALEREAGI
jgi:hypothetical protein